jgi:hypothetical protein
LDQAPTSGFDEPASEKVLKLFNNHLQMFFKRPVGRLSGKIQDQGTLSTLSQDVPYLH